VGGVEGFSIVGGGVGSLVTGGGVVGSLVVGGGVVGSLVTGGGVVSSLVVGGSTASVAEGDATLLFGGVGSSGVGIDAPDVVNVGWVSDKEGAKGLALAGRRSDPKLSRALASAVCTLVSVGSLSTPSSVVIWVSTCCITPGKKSSTTLNGLAFSEAGDNQVRSETTATNAPATPAPANKYPRLARPTLVPFRRAGRAEA
jgi:hypothetical protein